MANRFSAKVPDIRGGMNRFYADIVRRQRRAALVTADRVSKVAQQLIQAEMQAVGLGRLSRAVKQTSALKKGASSPYGVVYAAGGDESLAGGALEAYSQGTTIRANKGTWLAFQTNVIPRRVGTKRMTPALYVSSGLESSLGKLIFKPTRSGRVAFLVVRDTTTHVRTGRIKLPGKRASKVRAPQREVVVFVLIRFTTRAKRFDKDEQAAIALEQVPTIADQAMGP